MDKEEKNIIIRNIKIDDLAEIFHLGEKIFTAKEVPTLYRTWDEYEVLTPFHTEPEYSFVAECEGKIAGFVIGKTIIKKYTAWNYGHLIWLGVSPEFQGCGIGKKLFTAFRDVMIENGIRMLLVDTERDNEGAIKFFKKQGFCNTQEHIYMTFNLDAIHQEIKEEQEDE